MDTQRIIEQAARELGVAPATYRKWRAPDRRVPHRWRLPILRWAAEHGQRGLTEADFDRAEMGEAG